MPVHRSKSVKHESAKPLRRDPYEVLGVSRNSTDQDIKSAYRKLALKYHPDKNANDPIAADIFKEATFSYKILSDSDKRRQYDTAGFEAVESESQELEVDLSSLGAVNTMFAALFSKIGVPIKTTVSTTILEEALNGMVTICPLALGQPLHRKVERQCAHFYSISITEEQARSGYVCQVQSPDKSKFKLLYFDQEENGGLSLALQEDSAKKGNITSAGMYFLCFPTYRLDQAAISMATTKDTDMAFFKKLDGFRPCEITELKAGTHVFAVYGDNFFRSASYQIEALCAAPFVEEKESLRAVEAQILSKKVELSNFETEYEEVLKHFTEMTSRYAQEMQAIDMLLKQRNEIKASYRVAPVIKSSSRSKKCKEAKEEGQLRGLRLRRTGSKSKNRSSSQEAKEDGQLRDESTAREKPRKKKWYKIPLKVHKR
ncbi:chaperone protein dnaJ 16 [Diospyros lotus]|uniref:chaperone protein dnaJ 16 n=1 Tax=Diospyros lotus TaxID=55363 RepID=UPI0022589BE6|nr:chaperone protein dnaJ 16 [Diospyros lotus]